MVHLQVFCSRAFLHFVLSKGQKPSEAFRSLSVLLQLSKGLLLQRLLLPLDALGVCYLKNVKQHSLILLLICFTSCCNQSEAYTSDFFLCHCNILFIWGILMLTFSYLACLFQLYSLQPPSIPSNELEATSSFSSQTSEVSFSKKNLKADFRRL